MGLTHSRGASMEQLSMYNPQRKADGVVDESPEKPRESVVTFSSARGAAQLSQVRLTDPDMKSFTRR